MENEELIDIINKCEYLVDEKIVLLQDMEKRGACESNSVDDELKELYYLKNRIISATGEGK